MADENQDKALQEAQKRYTRAAESLVYIREWLRNLDKYGPKDKISSVESFNDFRDLARSNLGEMRERIASMMDRSDSSLAR